MKSAFDYDEFITSKSRRVECAGFEPKPIKAPLFHFQKHVTELAIRKGRAAMFEECGLGKTRQQLEWARQVSEHTGGAVILLTPLDHADEKHICPLQLDVIERAIELWTNEGDLVYSPFTGIGSEGYGALSLKRRFIGSELKESYFRQACQNLSTAKNQLELF